MGGLVKSAGGLLGLGSGPKAPEGQFSNRALDTLNTQTGIFGDEAPLNANIQAILGGKDVGGLLGQWGNNAQQAAMGNELATGALTGSKVAEQQLMGNETQRGLYGPEGQLGKVEGKLNSLYDQGFNLTPEDQTMYGQMSGDIARQFGQQGNQAASNLASRGLSNSGAAGAMFSGLAGNQNEMLAKAQQSIAQQRFQNTMNQIGQYQNFVSGLGAQHENALQNQYGRQLAGAQNQRQGLQSTAQLQQGQNQAQNQYGLQAAGFEVENQPQNLMDAVGGAAAAGVGAAGKTVGEGLGAKVSKGLFG